MKKLVSLLLVLPLLLFSLGVFADNSEPIEVISEVSSVEPTPLPTQKPELTPEPTATPKPIIASPTPAPVDELLKEFKEYRHDMTQVVSFMFLFLCIADGILLALCAGRFFKNI